MDNEQCDCRCQACSTESALQLKVTEEGLKEQKAYNAFQEKERAFLERDWEQCARDREQEIVRRSLEVCISLMKCKPDMDKDSDIGKAVESKIKDLIDRLG